MKPQILNLCVESTQVVIRALVRPDFIESMRRTRKDLLQFGYPKDSVDVQMELIQEAYQAGVVQGLMAFHDLVNEPIEAQQQLAKIVSAGGQPS